MLKREKRRGSMNSFVIDPVELSQKLIRCNSVTPQDDGALDIVANTLSAHGFQIERLRFEGNNSYPVDNIFAIIGSGSPHICIMGHTDVVPVGDVTQWSYDPFGAVIDNGILYGRGAADMKTGVANGITAAIQFLREHPLCGTISFLITGDEEADSINGTAKVIDWMKAQNKLPDDALVCEPSNPETMGTLFRTGRRGSYSGELIVYGKQGHSAYPNLFVNPVERMIRLTSLLIDYEWDQGNEFMPKTHLAMTSIDVGNTSRNTVPAKASAKFNIRFNNLWTSKTIDKKLHEILSAADIPYELTYRSNSESFLTSSGRLTEALVKAVETISNKTPIADTGGGTSDARFIAPYCPVIEYGLITKTNHQVDEHMKIENIYTGAKTYLEFLKLYFKG